MNYPFKLSLYLADMQQFHIKTERKECCQMFQEFFWLQRYKFSHHYKKFILNVWGLFNRLNWMLYLIIWEHIFICRIPKFINAKYDVTNVPNSSYNLESFRWMVFYIICIIALIFDSLLEGYLQFCLLNFSNRNLQNFLKSLEFIKLGLRISWWVYFVRIFTYETLIAKIWSSVTLHRLFRNLLLDLLSFLIFSFCISRILFQTSDFVSFIKQQMLLNVLFFANFCFMTSVA